MLHLAGAGKLHWRWCILVQFCAKIFNV